MLTTLDRNLEVFLGCKEKILNPKSKWKTHGHPAVYNLQNFLNAATSLKQKQKVSET